MTNRLEEAIKKTTSGLHSAARKDLLRPTTLYVTVVERELVRLVSGHRGVVDKSTHRVSVKIFQAVVTNYCKYLIKRHRLRWWHCLIPGEVEKRIGYEKALEHAIWCLNQHYEYGLDL